MEIRKNQLNDGLFTSTTDMWATPQSFFNKLDERFHFTLDSCAVAENSKCANFFSPEQDALQQDWKGVVWMNPPYGRVIGKWVAKAYEEAQKGATVVCLLPARTCSQWWHEYCMKGAVYFVKGRLKFGGVKNNAPFPSAIVVFKQGDPEKGTLEALARDGSFLTM